MVPSLRSDENACVFPLRWDRRRTKGRSDLLRPFSAMPGEPPGTRTQNRLIKSSRVPCLPRVVIYRCVQNSKDLCPSLFMFFADVHLLGCKVGCTGCWITALRA